MAAIEVGILGKIAFSLGITQPALRLLISILLSYPLAVLHRNYVYGKYKEIQHLAFTACGLAICYFNYGASGTIHSFICIVMSYIFIILLGSTHIMVVTAITFQMGYLLIGYYYTETDNYDITWTMPHCVLCLRLIALALDVYDGGRSKKTNDLSEEQKKTALYKTPSLQEVFGYAYFFGTLMVGPQIPLRRYQDFVSGDLISTRKDEKPSCIKAAVERAALGFGFILVCHVISQYFPENYPLTDEFKNLSFLTKCVTVSLWGQAIFAKYISCWLLVEGGCILTGITYNGKDKEGKERWDACANVDVLLFLRCVSFTEIILCFNIRTNKWAANYVYKRLKFVGNQTFSHVATLMFLAVWHGFHVGYYIAFSLEFLVIFAEKQIQDVVTKNPTLNKFYSNDTVKVAVNVLRKIYMFPAMAYCMLGITQRSLGNTLASSASMYFLCHVIYITIVVTMTFLKPRLVTASRKNNRDGKKS